MDLGISVWLNFRPCNTFVKHTRYHKYQENNNFWGALLMVFASIFWVFVLLSLGHAALRLCLPDLKLSWGGMERVQTQFLMTESAGTAQGVDAALT